MDGKQAETRARAVSEQELLQLTREVPLLAGLKPEELGCLGPVELVEAPAGTTLCEQGAAVPGLCVLLEGDVRARRKEENNVETPLASFQAGDTFGEAALLLGSKVSGVQCDAATDVRLLRVDVEGFWRLMATCPTVRQGILSNAAQRIQAFQATTLHREKLISLGTLAAGLMHELKNPGSAAKRSAALLRENLMRLQDISLRFCRSPLSQEQTACLLDLQREVLALDKPKAASTLEESDAEEELGAWLESLGVHGAWKLAPTLVAAGWRRSDIACTQEAFPAEALQDALNWLESLISAMQQLTTIEESLGRVTDLVMAVKKYAYEDKNGERLLDVHESIQSTLTILGHKFRYKQLTVEKDFPADLPKLKTRGTGLSQVWTNLLDNAVDAAPEGSKVRIRTWAEGDAVCVGIADQGSGIPAEQRELVFRPFYTTKPAGVGTGLGLDIAKRIVTGQYNGTIGFTSEPGRTEFVVRLPQETAAGSA
ncbi:MAG TPA: ATP-binding protein [Acidobacteriaceae bacterium]|jgi:signal transduction histidine kinase|nr:ATP-binding protein [Acidobacteriaceae bacterium]